VSQVAAVQVSESLHWSQVPPAIEMVEQSGVHVPSVPPL
jgi:hypothetical protein